MKKRMLKILFVIIFLIILLKFSSAIVSTNFHSNVTVITSGGTGGIIDISSTNYSAIMATGDIIGNTSSTSYTNEFGFIYSIFTLTTNNTAPNSSTIPDQNWSQDTTHIINLTGEFFSDTDNDVLTFSSTTPSDITVSISGSVVTLIPNSGFFGTNYITFTASDGIDTTDSNNITLTVNQVVVEDKVEEEVTPAISFRGSTGASLPSKTEFPLRPEKNIITNFPPNSAIVSININILSATQDAKIIAHELPTVTVPRINAYAFLEILAFGVYFDKAIITFKVSNDWIISHNIDEDSITLMLREGSWVPLETEKLPGSAGVTHFRAETSKLGTFAITGRTKLFELPEEEEKIIAEIVKEVPREEEIKITQILKKIKEERIIYIIVAIIIILIIMLILFTKKQRRLNKIRKIKKRLDKINTRLENIRKKEEEKRKNRIKRLKEDLNKINARFEDIKKREEERKLRKIKRLKEKLGEKTELKKIKKKERKPVKKKIKRKLQSEKRSRKRGYY